MLDVITDFWKPVKKTASQEKPDLGRLEAGSTITFGFVPQAMLSGRKLKVGAVNTYQFGDERMTSFLLAQDRDDSLSLIVASAEGEQYLALSRRIPFADRMRMFDPQEVEAVQERDDAKTLAAREVDSAWKHWLVPSYAKQLSNVKGSLMRGDYRTAPLPAAPVAQSFDYVLLASENNEYAIEMEKYADGRFEMYATVYLRVGDIAEVEHPQASMTPATTDPLRVNAVAPVLEIVKNEPPVLSAPTIVRAVPEKPAAPVRAEPALEAKPAEAVASLPKAEEKPAPAAAVPEEKAKEESVPEPVKASEPEVSPQPESQPKEQPMQFSPAQASSLPNGAAAYKQEIKAVTRSGAENENEAIECELRVASKLIEEAIRNEIRLSDVVRRIIALPVANPESVQIPITLTDSDYALLAIRYGISSSDKEAIKTRIIDEVNDFSGNGGKK